MRRQGGDARRRRRPRPMMRQSGVPLARMERCSTSADPSVAEAAVAQAEHVQRALIVLGW